MGRRFLLWTMSPNLGHSPEQLSRVEPLKRGTTSESAALYAAMYSPREIGGTATSSSATGKINRNTHRHEVRADRNFCKNDEWLLCRIVSFAWNYRVIIVFSLSYFMSLYLPCMLISVLGVAIFRNLFNIVTSKVIIIILWNHTSCLEFLLIAPYCKSKWHKVSLVNVK